MNESGMEYGGHFDMKEAERRPSETKSLTPEQVERARTLLSHAYFEWDALAWKVKAVELLREVVGE